MCVCVFNGYTVNMLTGPYFLVKFEIFKKDFMI